jgi:hypothetical protein
MFTHPWVQYRTRTTTVRWISKSSPFLDTLYIWYRIIISFITLTWKVKCHKSLIFWGFFCGFFSSSSRNRVRVSASQAQFPVIPVYFTDQFSRWRPFSEWLFQSQTISSFVNEFYRVFLWILYLIILLCTLSSWLCVVSFVQRSLEMRYLDRWVFRTLYVTDLRNVNNVVCVSASHAQRLCAFMDNVGICE